jgi:hypothetical protein
MDADMGSGTSSGTVSTDPCQVIEVHVAESRDLFHAIDPSPFKQRDLDPVAEDFIVGWARESRQDVPFALVVYVDSPVGPPDESTTLREAVRTYFAHRARSSKRTLRQLFRVGRTSLLIGLTVLASCLVLADFSARILRADVSGMVRESLLIGGWVAMWRPIEIFLYDWWPIRAEAQLADRLAAMPVRIVYKAARGTGVAPVDTVV